MTSNLNIDLTKRMPRGAIPSTRAQLAAATPHLRDLRIGAPPSVLLWPVQMSDWGNYVDGDCVTAEEAFAKATASPQQFFSADTVITWASAHGDLNGATLPGVMSTMQTSGFPLNRTVYNDGPYKSVDWTDAATLQSAIAGFGPVKLGVGAEAFQTNPHGLVTPGNSGWAMFNYPTNQPEDHCVSLCGYGSLADLTALFKNHGVTVRPPANMPSGMCYAVFSWNSIGIIDQQSMLNMTYEAWIRSPATIIKNTLGETSPKSPALASLNGLLYLGWKGDGNDHLNVSCSADNGATFGGKFVSPETSPQAPAMCAHNGAVYIAWKGDGNDHLNVARVATAGAGVTGFTNKVTLGDTSPVSPALASYNGRLYLAWKGDGNDHLNLMVSSDNGATFGNKFVSAETSPQPPALAVHDGKLFVGWKGDGNDQLNVAQVVVSGTAISGLAGKVVLPDTSPYSPSLASFNGTLCLGWKGDGNDHLNIESSGNDGLSFGGKTTLGETSAQAPALCTHNGALYFGWKGSGNDNLNVARF